MDDFLKACGAMGPLDLMIESPGRTAMRWRAFQPFALIGSDPAADLALDHPRIDGHHVYLQLIEGEVYWVDLGSQSGTRHGSRVARCGWLMPPHGIGIGPYTIQLATRDREPGDAAAGSAPRSDPFASRPLESDDLLHVVLEFRRDSAKPIRWRMRHTLTLVGSSPQCKVRLAAPGVAPFHCSLLRTPAGVWVVNLSREAVIVNGSSVRAARLEDGDRLEIGAVSVRPIFKGSASEALRNGATAGREITPMTLIAHPALPSKGLADRRPSPAWPAPDYDEEGLLAGRSAEEGEFAASLLATVLDRFGQMQQQFLDQYQQTTLMMFRALGTMHREQMEELREQLDALQQLREDFQALQSRIAGATMPPDAGPPAYRAAGADPAGPGAARNPNGDATGDARQQPPAGTGHPAPPANGGPKFREKARSSSDPSDPQNTDLHKWMIDRLAAMEDEQRTRWQKITDLMRGR